MSRDTISGRVVSTRPVMSSYNQFPNYPRFSSSNEARVYLDSLKTTLIQSWHGVEHTIKSLSDALQEKTNYIESLRTTLTACEHSSNEKSSKIQEMEQMILHLHRQIQEKELIVQQNQVIAQERETTLQAVMSQNTQIRERYNAGIQEMRGTLSMYQARNGALYKENEELKAKLAQAQDHNRAVAQELKLTDEQRKQLKEAISKELTQKSALTSAKAKELLLGMYEKYQQRITELEEQLKLQSGPSDSNNNPLPSDEIQHEQPDDTHGDKDYNKHDDLAQEA